MSLLEKDGYEYADGGMGNIVPIAEAIDRGATTIDIIVLKTEKPGLKMKPVKNALELTTRTFDFMMNQIITDDILIEKLKGTSKKIDLNFYHPPELLTKNSLIFDSEMMTLWWKQGYEFAKNHSPSCHCIEPEVPTL